jgi:hypothetical protein
MGLLNLFSKPAIPSILRLSSGSFTVDRSGKVLVSTIASSFPEELIHLIGEAVLTTFREAAAAQMALTELAVNYPSLKVRARELRGGAIVFLSAQAPYSTSKTH